MSKGQVTVLTPCTPQWQHGLHFSASTKIKQPCPLLTAHCLQKSWARCLHSGPGVGPVITKCRGFPFHVDFVSCLSYRRALFLPLNLLMHRLPLHLIWYRTIHQLRWGVLNI